MPLAFDLTSTLVFGWTLPVATTERAMSPRSTVASFDASMLFLGLRAARRPTPAPVRTMTRTPHTINHVRERFPFIAMTTGYTNGVYRKFPPQDTISGF